MKDGRTKFYLGALGTIGAGAGLILMKLIKAVKETIDEESLRSETEREFMKLDYDDAVAQIKHMWNLGEKYIGEHPEAEFRTND